MSATANKMPAIPNASAVTSWDVVEGSDTLANAVVEMRKDTRQFARRQRTWLRAVEEAVWMDPTAPKAIYARVAEFLGSPTR